MRLALTLCLLTEGQEYVATVLYGMALGILLSALIVVLLFRRKP